jgi:TPR repeat protein
MRCLCKFKHQIKRITPIFTLLTGLFFFLSAEADYEDGVNAAFSGDFETAFKEFFIAAEEGLSLAQYNLGILYFTGQGVEQNFDEAFKWTKAAAEQGHLNAQFNLGSLFLDGQGTSKNIPQGIEWFSQAAKNGHSNAAYSLAKMHQEGEIIGKDLVQAHAWAAQSAINEHPEGSQLKLEIESNLSNEEISQARRLFAAWQIQ